SHFLLARLDRAKRRRAALRHSPARRDPRPGLPPAHRLHAGDHPIRQRMVDLPLVSDPGLPFGPPGTTPRSRAPHTRGRRRNAARALPEAAVPPPPPRPLLRLSAARVLHFSQRTRTAIVQFLPDDRLDPAPTGLAASTDIGRPGLRNPVDSLYRSHPR